MINYEIHPRYILLCMAFRENYAPFSTKRIRLLDR